MENEAKTSEQDKPEGPVWVDFSHWLFNAPTSVQLVALANLALNRLTLRDIGEICYDAGIDPMLFNFVPRDTPTRAEAGAGEKEE